MKRGKEIKLDLNPNYKIKVGTVDNKSPKTIYINLKLSDINNLDLRKLVYISGYYYRINKISDYSPNNNDVTKVELVLWENQGKFIPAL